jgi:hypothetical protein
MKLIELYQFYRKQIVFVIDGHNTDLAEHLRYELAPFQNVIIVLFTKKDLVATSERVNNAFVEEKLYLTDEPWIELLTNQEIHQSMLFNELQTVCWREDDPTKFNDAIPNDMTDAIRYPVAHHATPYQLDDFQRKGGE